MKKVFYNSWLAKHFLRGAHTITIGPFILSKRDFLTQGVKNHECVHSRQWVEMTIASGLVLWLLLLFCDISVWWLALSSASFYIWYVLEYIVRLCILRNHSAYKAISFEQEARHAENDNNYLENAHYFSWIKYLNRWI